MPPTVISIQMNVDDEFTLYIGTNNSQPGRFVGSGNGWPTTYSFEVPLTPGVTNFIQVAGINTGGPAGLLGQFKLSDSRFRFANGTGTLLTNINDWKVSFGIWAMPAQPATSFGANGPQTVWGVQQRIDPAAQWIWATSPDIFQVSLSAEIHYVSS